MLLTLGSHIMELHLTPEIIRELLKMTGENIMPNWTNNTIIGKKSILQKYVLADEDMFDFNKLIPMPKSLDIESGSNSYTALIALAVAKPEEFEVINQAWKALNVFNKSLKQEPKYQEALKNPDFKNSKDFEDNCAFGQVLLDNFKSYGSCDWYDWRCKHWGTKWNASNCYIDDYGEDLLQIQFDTAWNAPIPIFRKLVERYPNDGFVFEWQNEDDFKTHYFIASNQNDILSIDEIYDDDYHCETTNYEEIDNFKDDLLRSTGLIQ
jgi:hypothetical protein